MAITKYDLDINKQAIMKPVVILRQGDHDIDTMEVWLSVANEPMDLTGATVKFMGNTANGRKIIDDTNVKITNAKGGVFEYVFPSEAASDIGEYKVAYFSIILANGQSSTMDFRVQVLSGVDISAPVASEYITHYDTMVTELNSAYDSATRDTNEKMASTVSSLATSAATVLDSALARVNTINSTANNASSAASKAVSMASSVASAVTSQASYINSVASSAASNVSSVAAGVVDKLNNISVGGRNLVLGTSTDIAKANDWNMTLANIKNDKSLGGNVTASVMINNADHASELQRGSAQIILDALDASGNILKSTKGATVSYNANGISWCSISFDDNTTTVRVRIQTINMMANAYYSRLKVEKGNIPTDWTPAPEDAPIGLSVGGRNLLLDTGRSFTGIGDGSAKGDFNAQGGQYYLVGGKKVSDLYKQYGPAGYLTLSFDWVASGDNISGQFNSEWNNTPWIGVGDSRENAIKPSVTNTSGHFESTVPLNTSGYSTGNANGVRFRRDNLQGNITISNLKLEAGNIATDWTPAPEDADNTFLKKSGDTMTGNLTAPQVIANDLLAGFHNVVQVPTTTTKIIDLINNDFIKSRGFWKEQTFVAYNTVLSDAPTNDSYSIIKLTTRGLARTYVEYSDLSGNVWHTTATGIVLNRWVKQANDDEVVHNTMTETVAGDKTFTGNTTLANIKSSNVKTGSVKLNGLTFDFRQTVVGVNVYMHGAFDGTFGTNQSYVTSSSVIPSNIDKPKQPVVLTIVSNGGVGGITTNSPWELEVLITTTGAIQYRAKNLRDNDITPRNTTIDGAASTFYSLD